MSYNQIVELCKQHHIIPIDKDLFSKDKNGGWVIDYLDWGGDSCMWTEKGYAFDGGRHCSSLAFIENDHHSGMTKSQVWDSIAEDIKFEGKDVTKCECNNCKEDV